MLEKLWGDMHISNVEVGNYGTAKIGDFGWAKAGHHGTAISGMEGTSIAGPYGTAKAGPSGTAKVGHGGRAAAGQGGILMFTNILLSHTSNFIVDVETEILPDVWYRLSSSGELICDKNTFLPSLQKRRKF